MENPWERLKLEDPYILEEDRIIIEQFNLKADKLYQFQLNVLPQPFMGFPKLARVVLLNLNPGFNFLKWEEHHKIAFEENVRQLSFKSTYPFFFLNPKLAGSGGYEWWTKILKSVINDCGLEQTSKNLMCIEYIGYHSNKFALPKSLLPSQQFAFYLVREAINNKKEIIIMRGKSLWLKNVPELSNYPYKELKNLRRPYISPNNMQMNDFDRIVELIKS